MCIEYYDVCINNEYWESSDLWHAFRVFHFWESGAYICMLGLTVLFVCLLGLTVLLGSFRILPASYHYYYPQMILVSH